MLLLHIHQILVVGVRQLELHAVDRHSRLVDEAVTEIECAERHVKIGNRNVTAQSGHIDWTVADLQTVQLRCLLSPTHSFLTNTSTATAPAM